ncbi:hypothetical protein XENOCAPTIV_018058, partial [Xenoophorus captivus]
SHAIFRICRMPSCATPQPTLTFWRQSGSTGHSRRRMPGLYSLARRDRLLVGFGDFKYETLESLYESVDPKKIR